MKAAIALALVLALGGCSLTPGTPQRPAAPATASTTALTTSTTSSAAGAMTGTSSTSPPAEAQPSHEVPTPVPRQAVAGGWHSPAQAVQAFASAYVNWNYRTVSLHLRTLAAVSVGQARSMLTMAATQAGRDDELRRGEIANSGVVEAIGPVAGQGDEYAVVTRERTTAANTSAYQGLAPAWHVALATVTRVRGLWVLSAWQPES